jgi:hypothetical protein
VGVLLRLSNALTYDARIGYDFRAHWPTIMYVPRSTRCRRSLSTAAAHPPLYYVIAAAWSRWAGRRARSAGCRRCGGSLRLVLIWVALERWLPESRLARRVALALAAVLPVARTSTA